MIERRISRPMRKSQKPGFSRYLLSPNQKLVETRFLAPTVNLRNRVSLDIYRHLTQKLVETRFLAPCVNNKYMSLRALSEAIAKTKIASFLAMTILGFLGLDEVSRLHDLRK